VRSHICRLGGDKDKCVRIQYSAPSWPAYCLPHHGWFLLIDKTFLSNFSLTDASCSKTYEKAYSKKGNFEPKFCSGSKIILSPLYTIGRDVN
jgi:hypothetical protein